MIYKAEGYDVKKVCVIGGAGFLGSHVCDQLTEAGFKVYVYDRHASSFLRDDQTMIQADILNQQALMDAIGGCKYVYNFAAIADLDEAIDKPLETVKINVLGNTMVLEACRRKGVERYIYASTVYVHSRDGGFYRCSKHAAEQFTEEYQRRYGLNFTILRYGSLYGPRSDNHNGLWRIVKKAVEEGVISYVGSPEAMREYIHVIDAARASVTALGDDFLNQHVVLTGQEPMRVVDLLKMLAEIMGMPQAVEFVDTKKDGHYIRTPYAYQTRLGRKYVPPMHVDLGQGLLELIEEVQREKLSVERAL